MAMRARAGERKIKMTVENRVPIKLNTMPTPRALAPCPFIVSGWPSKQVATEEGVPGMCIRIAEIRPPEIPPMYKETSNTIPCAASIP